MSCPQSDNTHDLAWVQGREISRRAETQRWQTRTDIGPGPAHMPGRLERARQWRIYWSTQWAVAQRLKEIPRITRRKITERPEGAAFDRNENEANSDSSDRRRSARKLGVRGAPRCRLGRPKRRSREKTEQRQELSTHIRNQHPWSALPQRTPDRPEIRA